MPHDCRCVLIIASTDIGLIPVTALSKCLLLALGQDLGSQIRHGHRRMHQMHAVAAGTRLSPHSSGLRGCELTLAISRPDSACQLPSASSGSPLQSLLSPVGQGIGCVARDPGLDPVQVQHHPGWDWAAGVCWDCSCVLWLTSPGRSSRGRSIVECMDRHCRTWDHLLEPYPAAACSCDQNRPFAGGVVSCSYSSRNMQEQQGL